MIRQKSPGLYTFMNVNSRKFLAIRGASPLNGARVVQSPATGGTNQQWTFTPTGDGYYKFSPASQSNASLDIIGSTIHGTAIQQWTWLGAPWQQWTIAPAN